MRHLDWEGCFNARDLGGLPTTDGGETRWGSVVRSDVLLRLNRQGREALLAHGVRTIVDLRSLQERAAAPYTLAVPVGSAAPEYLHRPFESRNPHIQALMEAATTRDEIYGLVLDHYPESFVQALRAIATAPAGGIVVHCHSGKDRTGLVAALLLSLAGVPDEVIAEDYAASQARLWPLYEQRLAMAGNETDRWLAPVCPPEVMLATLAQLKERHGSIPAYLTAAGLSGDELVTLAHRLR